MAQVKLEYVLLGLGAAGLAAYWYFFLRKPPVPPHTIEVKVVEA